MTHASLDRYELFARFYDLEFASFDEDLGLYRQFSVEAGGPILELGCGTGRVLVALADLGLPLTGIDTSPAMLAIARKRLGPSITLVQADMRELHPGIVPGAPFWMAFSAINTFLHLADADQQIQALTALRSVVVAGGLLVLDLFSPDPHYIGSLDGRVVHEFDARLPEGDRLDKWVARTVDVAAQTIETRVWYDLTAAASGQVTRFADRYQTRYIYRFELEHLLARCGWRVISVFGSYDLDPYTAEAERMIVLATWGEDRMHEER